MDPRIQGFGRLGIGNAEANQATEAGLHMGAWTTETVIQLEVPERGIQVIARQEVNGALTQPHAFRIGRRTGQRPGRLGNLISPPRPIAAFGVVGFLLIGRFCVASLLGEGRGQSAGHQRDAGHDGEATHTWK